MSDLEYGPVEILLIGYDGDKPDAGVVESILELVANGAVRIIDALLVSRAPDGEVTAVEMDATAADYGLDDELELAGLTSDDDILELGEQLDPGTRAEMLVVELLWAKKFASRLDAAGGRVISSTRIPAPIVNDVVRALRD